MSTPLHPVPPHAVLRSNVTSHPHQAAASLHSTVANPTFANFHAALASLARAARAGAPYHTVVAHATELLARAVPSSEVWATLDVTKDDGQLSFQEEVLDRVETLANDLRTGQLATADEVVCLALASPRPVSH